MSKPTTEQLDILQFGRVLHERPRTADMDLIERLEGEIELLDKQIIELRNQDQSMVEVAILNSCRLLKASFEEIVAELTRLRSEVEGARAKALEEAAKAIEPAPDLRDDELTEYGQDRRELGKRIRALLVSDHSSASKT